MIRSPDPLHILADARHALIGLKSRDFAAEYLARNPHHEFPATSLTVLAITDGKPITIQSAAQYNANRRLFELHHTVEPRYRNARRRAMRPVALQGVAA